MWPMRGFTLLEPLVVVAIIGLLVACVGPRYAAQIGKSEITAARAQMKALAKALDTYRLDTGHYPSAQQGLKALREWLAGEVRWNGPYLSKDVPADPWGKPYVYRMPGVKGDYELISFGRDGVPGGTVENADITY